MKTAILGLRLLAIYCFIEAIPRLVAAGVTAAMPQMGAFTLPAALGFAPGLSLLAIGILLLVFSEPLATRMAPASPPENLGACSFEQAQALVFVVAGILILAMAFPALGRAVLGIAMEYHDRTRALRGHAGEHAQEWLYGLGVLGQIVIGFFLLLRPDALKGVTRRVGGTGG